MITEAIAISEWALLSANSANFQQYHGQEQVDFQRNDDEVRFVLDQHT